MSGNYSLSAAVYNLAVLLEVAGEGRAFAQLDESRESLREHFRKMVRLLKRLKADELKAWTQFTLQDSDSFVSDWPQRSVRTRPLPPPENIFAPKAPSSKDEQLLGAWAEHGYPASLSTSLNGLPAPVPFSTMWPSKLDVAIRVGRDGVTALFAEVMDLWSRRHDILKADAAIEPPPRRRRSVDRLFLAVMRFVAGFFGSHKVDARNNP